MSIFNEWNAIINNPPSLFIFFSKYWKLDQIKDFKVYFGIDILQLSIN